MVINHNMSAAYANRQLSIRDVALKGNMEKLSSGMKINKGADDASGLAVSEKLRSQVRGLTQASKNVGNAISFIQTTEGYLNETQDILGRIRELAVQSANGIYTDEDRSQIQVEVSQLVDEVNRIASHAQFNGMSLLQGAFVKNSGDNVATASMWFQVGANMDQREQVFIGTMTAAALKIEDGQNGVLKLAAPDDANKAIGILDDALKTVSKQRADLGAYQNRFQMAVKGIDIAAENMQAAESQLRDTDMATEMVDYVKNQILNQAGNAMLAQANTQSQSVLRLLG
jgi:flagellin